MKKILNIAHRGFSGKYPENTLIAFQKALEIGVDGIECDIGLTADHELVVFHDSDLSRLVGEKGRLESTQWSDLKKMKVFGKEPVCHLDDLLSLDADWIINLELKLTAQVNALSEKLSKRLENYSNVKNLVISSFSGPVLQAAQKALPKGPKYALIFESFTEKKFKAFSCCDWIDQWNVRGTAVFENGVDRTKPIWVWTLNDEAAWEKAMAWDGPLKAILSDHPNKLANYLQKN